MALATPTAGRLRTLANDSGGLVDITGVHEWQAGEPVAVLETAGPEPTGARLRAMYLAGSRSGWAVDNDATVLPGWNARARAWWGDRIGRDNTLVSLGLCDATALVRGSDGDFAEFFALAGTAFHVAHHSEHPLVYCATVLLEQLQRGETERTEIARDLVQRLNGGRIAPGPDDMQFIGALLARLQASPLTERPVYLGAAGAERLAPPRFALLSLLSEPTVLLRHRDLGYHIHILAHDIRAAGPAAKAVLKDAFTPVTRSIEDIRASFLALAAQARRQTRTRLVVLNMNSADRGHSVPTYHNLGADFETRISHVFANALNVMIDDLAAADELDVVDLDLRAAQLGTTGHIPDGVHSSSALQSVLRRDLIAVLARHGGLAGEVGALRDGALIASA